MKYIDLDNWPRKDHYSFFSKFDYPQFNICGNLDITNFYKFIKEREMPFFISTVYASSKAANLIPELKLRIRDGRVVEHEVVSPSFTVMTESDLFSFCTVEHSEPYEKFNLDAEREINNRKVNGTIENEPGRDDLLYVTSIPWFSFTSVTHPIHMNPVDSIPRISWGKYFEENGKIKLPFSVQVHHALVDGLHVGQYFNLLQEFLDNPSTL